MNQRFDSDGKTGISSASTGCAHNVPRIRTHADVLTFYPGNVLPDKVETRRRRRAFQTQLARALATYFATRTPIKQSLGKSGTYPQFILGNRAVIAVDPDESTPVVCGIMRAAVAWSNQVERTDFGCSTGGSQPDNCDPTSLHAGAAIRFRLAAMEWKNNRTP